MLAAGEAGYSQPPSTTCTTALSEFWCCHYSQAGAACGADAGGGRGGLLQDLCGGAALRAGADPVGAFSCFRYFCGSLCSIAGGPVSLFACTGPAVAFRNHVDACSTAAKQTSFWRRTLELCVQPQRMEQNNTAACVPHACGKVIQVCSPAGSGQRLHVKGRLCSAAMACPGEEVCIF